jgi:hypothetical protein
MHFNRSNFNINLGNLMAVLGIIVAVLELLLGLGTTLVFVGAFETSLFRSIKASEISKHLSESMKPKKQIKVLN